MTGAGSPRATREELEAVLAGASFVASYRFRVDTLAHGTCTLLRVGRRTIFGTAESLGRDGRLLAHHTISYATPG